MVIAFGTAWDPSWQQVKSRAALLGVLENRLSIVCRRMLAHSSCSILLLSNPLPKVSVVFRFNCLESWDDFVFLNHNVYVCHGGKFEANFWLKTMILGNLPGLWCQHEYIRFIAQAFWLPRCQLTPRHILHWTNQANQVRAAQNTLVWHISSLSTEQFLNTLLSSVSYWQKMGRDENIFTRLCIEHLAP